MRNFLFLIGFVAACNIWATACDNDDNNSSDVDSDTDTDTDTDADSDIDSDIGIDTDECNDVCNGADAGTDIADIPPPPENGTALEGEYCYWIDHCDDGLYCDSYRMNPPDINGSCRKCPSDKNQWVVQGTVQDIETGELVPNAYVKFIKATDMQLQGCKAKEILGLTSCKCGRFRGVASKKKVRSDGLGIGAAVCNYKGYYPGGIPVAGSPYRCGIRANGVAVIREDTLDEWSKMLIDDSEMKRFMPLGKKGGIIVRIYDVNIRNKGVPNAYLKSRSSNSIAKIRYLNEEKNAWVTDKTSSNGYCVIVDTGLAEVFDAYIDDKRIGITEATAISKQNFIYLFPIPVETGGIGL